MRWRHHKNDDANKKLGQSGHVGDSCWSVFWDIAHFYVTNLLRFVKQKDMCQKSFLSFEGIYMLPKKITWCIETIFFFKFRVNASKEDIQDEYIYLLQLSERSMFTTNVLFQNSCHINTISDQAEQILDNGLPSFLFWILNYTLLIS